MHQLKLTYFTERIDKNTVLQSTGRPTNQRRSDALWFSIPAATVPIDKKAPHETKKNSSIQFMPRKLNPYNRTSNGMQKPSGGRANKETAIITTLVVGIILVSVGFTDNGNNGANSPHGEYTAAIDVRNRCV